MENIINAIKCCNCKQILKSPIILPCGHSICNKHVSEKGLIEIYCYECLKCFKIPKDGFNPNTVLDQIIELQIARLDLGKNYNQAKDSCRKLGSKLDASDTLRSDPMYFIFETINELKIRVDLKREELKKKVDDEADKFLKELDDYINECKKHVDSSKEYQEQEKKIRENIDSIRSELNNWLKNLSILKVDEEKWLKIHVQSEEAITKMETLIKSIQQILLLNKFEASKERVAEFEKADFVELSQYQTAIKNMNSIFDSKILDYTMQKALFELCEFKSSDNKWDLLYRASRDGFGTASFHSRCDSKPFTLTIVKSNNGNIFGGYTESQWNDPDGKENSRGVENNQSKDNYYKRDNNAFVFSLVNKIGKPMKVGVSSGEEDFAIYCRTSNGPTFGRGCDFMINGDSNVNKTAWSNFGVSFGSDEINKLEKNSNESKSFLAGAEKFSVLEVEVFQRRF